MQKVELHGAVRASLSGVAVGMVSMRFWRAPGTQTVCYMVWNRELENWGRVLKDKMGQFTDLMAYVQHYWVESDDWCERVPF